MILTRTKKKTTGIKNGVYKCSIFSIRDLPGRVIIGFKTTSGVIDLILPITAETILKLGKIAYIGGIKEKEDVDLSSFINLQLKITISGGKIIRIQPV